MAYIMIEPKKNDSIGSAMKVVNLIRSDRKIRDNCIVSIVINGFNDHHIIVSCSDDETHSDVCCILNSNQDEYNYYNPDWHSPTY